MVWSSWLSLFLPFSFLFWHYFAAMSSLRYSLLLHSPCVFPFVLLWIPWLIKKQNKNKKSPLIKRNLCHKRCGHPSVIRVVISWTLVRFAIYDRRGLWVLMVRRPSSYGQQWVDPHRCCHLRFDFLDLFSWIVFGGLWISQPFPHGM
jgi:hypothetical protein